MFIIMYLIFRREKVLDGPCLVWKNYNRRGLRFELILIKHVPTLFLFSFVFILGVIFPVEHGFIEPSEVWWSEFHFFVRGDPNQPYLYQFILLLMLFTVFMILSSYIVWFLLVSIWQRILLVKLWNYTLISVTELAGLVTVFYWGLLLKVLIWAI